MATHDYVIANQNGAAVRADLNNALQAIVTNNSGASEPETTYAFQWWADTTADQLKLRNSDNDDWVVIQELDGTMLMEDGSAGSPGLAFADDTNTGIFSSAADSFNVATAGVERLEISDTAVLFNDPGNDVDFRVESNDNANMLFVDGGENRVGVGTATPDHDFHLVDATTPELVVEDSTNNCKAYVGASDTNGRIGTLSDHDLAFRTNDTEQMRLDSSGNLGLGTTSPRGLIHLHSSSAPRIDFTNTTTGTASTDGVTFSVDGSTGALNIIQREAQPIQVYTSNAEKMRIFDTGQTHHFSTGNGFFVGSSQGAGTTNWLFRGNRSRTDNTSGGSTVFYVYTNGNVENTNNSYGAISDAKLKENIVDATSQWDDLKALQVRKYNFIEGETHTQLGVIAQEVETVSPGLVFETTDRDEEGNDLGTVTKGVNYSVLYMKAVKALQEAMERIETLEAKVAALEAG
jgi:hypothetical protein|tara:strand:- start:1924 stop:3309 length:1386 start_codon:yes stop_codon:yes gene_type:complete